LRYLEESISWVSVSYASVGLLNYI
jgi:hypothetical protein